MTPSAPLPNVTYRRVWSLAWPMIIAGSSTPLLGLIDTAIIGQIGQAAPLGAIAVGTIIFNFIFWSLGFLRMGTTGLTAQAYGQGDEAEVQTHLSRATFVGLVIGVIILICQIPIGWLAFELFNTEGDVESLAKTYYAIRIWGAPASLVTYGYVGWFIGIQRTRWSLALQIWLNGINIILDVFFVMGLGWGVEGVAFGTLIAEWSTAFIGLLFVLRLTRSRTGHAFTFHTARLANMAMLKRMLSVNGDIFIRTLCLLMAFAFFIAQSAQEGTIVLAANYILLQLVTTAAFFLDGFAIAAESLVGSAIGSRNRKQLNDSVRLSTLIAGVTALTISIVYLIIGPWIIDALTTEPNVRLTARTYLFWVVIIPTLSVWCYQLDGIYIGATRTHDMRNLMLIAFAAYFLAWYTLTPIFGNHGLWATLVVFLIVRGITLTIRYPALVRESGTS